MLVSLLALLAMLLADGFSWLASDTRHVTLTSPPPVITPEEPYTITLALVGLGTIGVYLVLSRVLLRRRRPIEKPLELEGAATVPQPRRGAA